MNITLLPPERIDEMDRLFDMSRIPRFKETRLENLLANREICLIAEENGEIIGEISVMIQNANIPAAVIPNVRVYLFGFRVLEGFRGCGIGKRLLASAIAMCMKRGIFQFTIGVEKGNDGARRLYERCGFTPLLENCKEMYMGEKRVFDLFILNTKKKPNEEAC